MNESRILEQLDKMVAAGRVTADEAARLRAAQGPTQMTRLHDDLATGRREVEARLSLGQTGRQAALPWLRKALRGGMLPSVDSTKVVGLVALPGAMTGMILAGASPLTAVRVQMVVMYMLLGGTAFAALLAGHLTLGQLFTKSHQLVKSVRRVA